MSAASIAKKPRICIHDWLMPPYSLAVVGAMAEGFEADYLENVACSDAWSEAHSESEREQQQDQGSEKLKRCTFCEELLPHSAFPKKKDGTPKGSTCAVDDAAIEGLQRQLRLLWKKAIMAQSTKR